MRGATILGVLSRLLIWIAAASLAAGLALSQLLFGGWWYPALSAPALLLVGMAAIAASFVSPKLTGGTAPGAWCIGITLLFTAYLLWRQSCSPDAYAARVDFWLLGGALAVYLTAAWHVRCGGPVWLVTGVLFAMMAAQSLLVVVQFTAESPFHPWPDLARWFGLPRGDEAIPNHGFVMGTFATRGTLSAVLQSSVFLALGMLLWSRTTVAVKLLLLWVTAAGFVGLVLSLSRAAYTGVLGGLAVFALASFVILHRGAVVHRFWLGVGALGLAALALGLAFVVGLESFAVRMRLDALGADLFREELWFSVVPPMLPLDPWWGTGAGTFDLLASRYRSAAIDGRPFHAHNDWLQLLVEYGRIGLILGAVFFAVHCAAAWQNLTRVLRQLPVAGLLPQSASLGLLTGSLAALVAQGLHSIFDHRLHVTAPVLLAALCAGWMAGQRSDPTVSGGMLPPWWLRLTGIVLPLAAGVMLVWQVGRHAPAEYRALQAENFLAAGELEKCWDEVNLGLQHDPSNARLLVLAGECAGLRGNDASGARERLEWYRVAADSWVAAVRQRPQFAYALREAGLALDWSRRSDEALAFHLRAIGRDPGHASGYEYLGLHFWNVGRSDEAKRLLRLAQRLPGSRVAREFLHLIEQQQVPSTALPME